MSNILGILGGLANPYGAPSEGEWNLQEASFTPVDGQTPGTPVKFFTPIRSREESVGGYLTAMEQAQDEGGRRLAIYEYPYRDGQFAEDLGRMGDKFNFLVVFHGVNYQRKYAEFQISVIRQRLAGTLKHPVFGDVPARLQSYQFVHTHDKYNAVVLRATFIEDNSATITALGQGGALGPGLVDSRNRSALGTLTRVQSFVQQKIFEVSALLMLPRAVQQGLQQRLDSITGAYSRLLGQMAATFGSDSSLNQLGSATGSFTEANAGVTTSGTTLPPVFEVGLTPEEQAVVESQRDAYVNANQVTSQQLVFQSNVVRAQVAESIRYTDDNTGVDGAEISLAYRELAADFQRAAEACIQGTAAQTFEYTVPYEMSLREVAFLNLLKADRQNDLERLNPNIESINFIAKGTVLTVPAA